MWPWTGSAMGEVDAPLPPFTPIRQEKDSLEFLQTAMHFGGRARHESVFSQEHHLLSAPVTLLAKSRRHATVWQSANIGFGPGALP